VHEVLEAREQRLAVTTTSLAMVCELLERLAGIPDAWNELADTLDGITKVLESPLLRAGLRFVPVRRV
jgi:hypothetical protein